MRHHCPALACALLPMLALAAPVPSEPGRAIPYTALRAPMAAVQQADPEGIVLRSLCAESASPGQPLPVGLVIELRNGASHAPLPRDAHGCIQLPSLADSAAASAQVWINQPKEAVKLVESFRMRTPTSTRIHYAQLMESVPVVERIQREGVAIGDPLTGAPQGVELAFAPGVAQSVTVGTGSTARTFATDAAGHVRVPFDASLPATTPVTLSALPSALQPYSP